MSSMTYDEMSEAKAEREGALTALDKEIQRLNMAIDHLAGRLAPVLPNREDKVPGPEAQIRPLPESDIRQLIDRLAYSTSHLDRLIRDIDL